MNNPNIGLGLQTKLLQKLLITPQMRQSLSLLQMPITELSQELSSYIEENPMLEVADDRDDYSESVNLDDATAEYDNSDSRSLLDSLRTPEWDDYINDASGSQELQYTPLTPEDEQTNYEQYISKESTLTEHLLQQLQLLALSDTECNIGEAIIGNISEDGYFRYDIDLIAEEFGVTSDEAEAVLRKIQEFEPTGIAARNLVECITKQLPDVGASPGEILQIQELFDKYSYEMENYRYDDIQRKSGIDSENLDDLLALIRKTSPRPGLQFSANSSYIYPDVYIVRDGDDFDVVLNESGIPPLKLSSYYMKLLREAAALDTGSKAYIEEKMKGALWVIKSLQKRQKAIYKVTRAIVDVQKEFLLKGDGYLKPLRLKDIADVTELHESTVSRVTSGKYALCDFGLLELKSFFSKGMDTAEGDMSTHTIKNLIKEYIDSESSKNEVYSDDRLSQMLEEQGITVARRTIAKYREELGIPTMSQRKRMRR